MTGRDNNEDVGGDKCDVSLKLNLGLDYHGQNTWCGHPKYQANLCIIFWNQLEFAFWNVEITQKQLRRYFDMLCAEILSTNWRNVDWAASKYWCNIFARILTRVNKTSQKLHRIIMRRDAKFFRVFFKQPLFYFSHVF